MPSCDHPEGEALIDVNTMNSKCKWIKREACPVAEVVLCCDEEEGATTAGSQAGAPGQLWPCRAGGWALSFHCFSVSGVFFRVSVFFSCKCIFQEVYLGLKQLEVSASCIQI